MKKANIAFSRFIQVIALVLIVFTSQGNWLIIGSAILFGLGSFAEGLAEQSGRIDHENRRSHHERKSP